MRKPIWNSWRPRKPWRAYELPEHEEYPELYVRVDSTWNPGNYWYGLKDPLPAIPWPPHEDDGWSADVQIDQEVAELNRRIRQAQCGRRPPGGKQLRTSRVADHS